MTDIEKKALALVPEGQTPLNKDLNHLYLDVIRQGEKARDDGVQSPYHGHSLEHCLHAQGWVQRDMRLALDKAIEAHEAFKLEVSDAVEAVFAGYHDAPIPWVVMRRKLEPFILPKPDPLVEALNEGCRCANGYDEEDADNLRAALAARGLTITETKE